MVVFDAMKEPGCGPVCSELLLNPEEPFWVSGPSFCSHIRHIPKNSHNTVNFHMLMMFHRNFVFITIFKGFSHVFTRGQSLFG